MSGAHTLIRDEVMRQFMHRDETLMQHSEVNEELENI